MTCFIKVKTPNGAVVPGVRDLENPDFVTVFPGNNKDEEDLQGPAVLVKVSEGSPYEVV